MLKTFIPKEILEGERRVAAVPETVKRMAKEDGVEVYVEAGAGAGACVSDKEFERAGARVSADAAALFGEAGLVLKVRPPGVNPGTGKNEIDLLGEKTVLATTLSPFSNLDSVRRLAERKLTSFSMDFIPRITRAQKMDSLSSQANVAGYKAALIGANALGKYFPMLMTAAGTVKPARVVVIGAGVAGLQALATAKRLGAAVEVSDVRPAVKEQVESLGGKYIEVETDESMQDAGGYAKEASKEFLAKQQALLHERIAGADVVICTALVPGRKAPVIVTEEMVRDMRAGSVIVDLAVEQGGNCAVTEPGETVKHGVTVIGPLNLPAQMPVHASEMYAKNMLQFFLHLCKKGEIALDFEDEITRGAAITHGGRIVQEKIEEAAKGGAS